MKKLGLTLALLLVLIAVPVVQAQNYWVQVPPAGQILDVNGNHDGIRWANSLVHSTSVISLEGMDSIHLAFLFPDSVSVASISFIRLPEATSTWGDTVSTSLGTVVSTNGTGKFSIINSIQPKIVDNSRYGKFVITFAGSGNHYVAGLEKYKMWIGVFKRKL
jgi:hypothetical protein